MSGFQIPLDLKINFLENVLRPSFNIRPPLQNEDVRYVWMTSTSQNFYDPYLERLILAFNHINSVEQATEELTRLRKELHDEKQFLLQQQALQVQQQVEMQLQQINYVKTLRDGFPLLIQSLTSTTGSIPKESEHASCNFQIETFPFLPEIPSNVQNARNSIWEYAEDGCVLYSTETDIVRRVTNFLEEIVLALNLPLQFRGELTIKQIRPDLAVILFKRYFVGAVEVKKPGSGVLDAKTVVGELFDQMMLVEGFYGMGPAIGILTTGAEWRVTWFPEDTDLLTESNRISESSFSTPVKQKASLSNETKESSPPGNTPSQQRGEIHFIDVTPEDPSEIEIDDNDEISQEMNRLLHSTRVMNIYEEPVVVLQHLCGAFQLMSKSHLHQKNNLSRCLMKFHKNETLITFHPATYEEVRAKVNFNRTPNKNTKNLIALEDLGRGSTGKAWLCVTTSERSSACVLKFHNNNNYIDLQKERDMWHLVYPMFSTKVRVETWSGSFALMMPHFSTVLEQEREQYRDKVKDTLITHFYNKGKVHGDVRWRNIGKYRAISGEVVLIVYDLHSVVDYNVEIHQNWVNNAMNKLYEG
mmetsp:Transcript_20249/g.20954  ORF Transcript_20249/g.20954 Transcript_20249/m.20954 type:complete len:586 (+) Transcript_20249:63-1820(+)